MFLIHISSVFKGNLGLVRGGQKSGWVTTAGQCLLELRARAVFTLAFAVKQGPLV